MDIVEVPLEEYYEQRNEGMERLFEQKFKVGKLYTPVVAGVARLWAEASILRGEDVTNGASFRYVDGQASNEQILMYLGKREYKVNNNGVLIFSWRTRWLYEGKPYIARFSEEVLSWREVNNKRSFKKAMLDRIRNSPQCFVSLITKK